MSLRIYELLQRLINLGVAVIAFFLLLRVFFLFFSVNPTTPFVSWIMSVSSFLISPFAQIVPNITTQTGVLDIVAMVTLLIYLVVGYLLLNLIQAVSESQEAEYPPVVHYHDVGKSSKHTRE